MTKLTKSEILEKLNAFVRQRPGLEFGNYGSRSIYFSEMRSITRDRHHAETLLNAVSWRDSITADKLIEATRAFSGRLQFNEKGEIEYCTGQYWPTEYRKAVCAVLASALWDYWRTDYKTGQEIQKKAKKELGRSIGSRWFN